MTGYIKTSTIAEALHLSRKQTLERSRAENWANVKRKGGLEFLENRLPEAVRIALATKETQEPESAGDNGLSQLTDKARETAQNRSALLHDYRNSGLKPADFVEAYNSGQVSKYLLKELGQISVRTLYRWMQEHKEAGAAGTIALAALAPRYGIKKSGAGVTLSSVERQLLRKFWLQNT